MEARRREKEALEARRKKVGREVGKRKALCRTESQGVELPVIQLLYWRSKKEKGEKGQLCLDLSHKASSCLLFSSSLLDSDALEARREKGEGEGWEGKLRLELSHNASSCLS